MFILISDPGPRIPDPNTVNKKREKWKKLVFLPFVATNITKLKIIIFLNWLRKKFRPIYKEL
jgi:hypothetical protein